MDFATKDFYFFKLTTLVLSASVQIVAKITPKKESNLESRKLLAVWAAMIQRCHNPRCKSFKYYGDRGLSVCDEWRFDSAKFETWAMANGYKIGLSIDRIENDIGYSPENCRFVPIADNLRNRRICHKIPTTDFGRQLKEWRLRHGWIQKEAADILKVSIDTYRPWENGKTQPLNTPSMTEMLARLKEAK